MRLIPILLLLLTLPACSPDPQAPSPAAEPQAVAEPEPGAPPVPDSAEDTEQEEG